MCFNSTTYPHVTHVFTKRGENISFFSKMAGSHLSAQPVHGQDGPMVGLEVDEAVSGRLPGELVGHDFDGHDPLLAQGHHGVGQELLVHVGLEPADPEGADAGHCGVLRAAEVTNLVCSFGGGGGGEGNETPVTSLFWLLWVSALGFGGT